MEQPVVTGTARDASGAEFAVVGISNTPATDWAQVFRALAQTELTLAGGTAARAVSQGAGMTPPSVLDLNAYLMYAVGKAARRRLTERLAAHDLRLWHLTVMALVADMGPQMKTLLAARLDMNTSDLVKVVNDLVKAGHVVCTRDRDDRRKVLVRLTPEGRAFLDRLNADVAATDDDVLAPLSGDERRVLASLLRRVHQHLEPNPADAGAAALGQRQAPST
ncbi:MarR family winged helix-turn-helix transcriptional regulator [Streptomyces globosus]|uniref:MarR family winged helix-turn-helix transcriptional regulator n=1 Tax=Streptomyces TaxID=1883 RepID=UPI00163BC504|nr:MarR family winged helix-turn-helix transcriptional regulator [Streptomyces sp. WAC05292]